LGADDGRARTAPVRTAQALAMEVENLAGQHLGLLAAGLEPAPLGDAELAEAAARFAAHGRA